MPDVTGRGDAARRAWAVAAATVLGFAAACAHADFCGRVVAVHDGDTITVLAGGVERRVRLVGIDAPERSQPYGRAARSALSARVAGRDVAVAERGTDSYGRTLGRVTVAGVDANAGLVRDGYAWVYRRFENDASLIALEGEAKSARRGLWRDPHPVPPWVWRERQPQKPTLTDAAAPNAARKERP